MVDFRGLRFHDRAPVYQQIAEHLKRQILLGAVQDGDPMPRHDERLVQKTDGLPDAARRAQRRLFDKIPEGDAQVGAVAEGIRDRVGQIAERRGEFADAMVAQQFQRVLHDRPVHQPHHGFRAIAGQRTQA